ncbi:General stress protein [Bordetella sputigena]
MKAGRTDEHDKPADAQATDQPQSKGREGPQRVAHELDKQQDWDKAAQDRGYQPGDQGGYKGDYDQGKYETRDFGFPKKEDAERRVGSRQATPSDATTDHSNKKQGG